MCCWRSRARRCCGACGPSSPRIGVGQIVLTNASRVERHYFDTHVVEASTYRPLLIEGLQQAGTRGCRACRSIGSSGSWWKTSSTPCRAARHGSSLTRAITRRCWRSRANHRGQRVLLAIGPEGGWNEFELDLLTRHGFRIVSIGPRILRTDTACIALLTLLHEAMGR